MVDLGPEADAPQHPHGLILIRKGHGKHGRKEQRDPGYLPQSPQPGPVGPVHGTAHFLRVPHGLEGSDLSQFFIVPNTDKILHTILIVVFQLPGNSSTVREKADITQNFGFPCFKILQKAPPPRQNNTSVIYVYHT